MRLDAIVPSCGLCSSAHQRSLHPFMRYLSETRPARATCPRSVLSCPHEVRYRTTEVPLKMRCGMVIVYMMTALMGGLISCVLLWPHGAAIALLSIPFGGSLFVMLAAILVYMRASGKDRAAYTDLPRNLQTRESRR